jgi:hypothetical protein
MNSGMTLASSLHRQHQPHIRDRHPQDGSDLDGHVAFSSEAGDTRVRRRKLARSERPGVALGAGFCGCL